MGTEGINLIRWVLKHCSVLLEESSDLNKISISGTIISDELSDDSHLLGGVYGLSWSKEVSNWESLLRLSILFQTFLVYLP